MNLPEVSFEDALSSIQNVAMAIRHIPDQESLSNGVGTAEQYATHAEDLEAAKQELFAWCADETWIWELPDPRCQREPEDNEEDFEDDGNSEDYDNGGEYFSEGLESQPHSDGVYD